MALRLRNPEWPWKREIHLNWRVRRSGSPAWDALNTDHTHPKPHLPAVVKPIAPQNCLLGVPPQEASNRHHMSTGAPLYRGKFPPLASPEGQGALGWPGKPGGPAGGGSGAAKGREGPISRFLLAYCQRRSDTLNFCVSYFSAFQKNIFICVS